MSNLDPRVVFYLERQKQIDQWANLRKEATKSANRFFASLAEDLSTLAENIEDPPRFVRSLDGSYPKLLFCRSSWFQEGHHLPQAAIGLEWPRGSALFDSSYAGIWVNRDSGANGHQELAASLKKLTEEQRLEKELKTSAWWPAYQYEKPARSDYWNDLPAFRETIVRDIEDFWQMFRATIEQALQAIQS